MKSIYLLSVAFFSMVASTPLHGVELEIPPTLSETIQKALEVAADTSLGSKNPAAFAQMLEKLDKLIDASTLERATKLEGESLQAKIIVLARHYREHPDLYKAVQTFYIEEAAENAARERKATNCGNTLPIVERTPSLQPQHTTPQHRLPWEFHVLVRWLPGCPEGLRSIALQALAKIGDQDCAPTLVHCFKQVAVDPRGNSQTLNQTFAHLPGEKTLNAWLESLQFWRDCEVLRSQNAAALPIPGLEADHDAVASALEEVKRLRNSPEIGTAWRRIFLTLPHGSNIPHVPLLDEIKQAFDAAPTKPQ